MQKRKISSIFRESFDLYLELHNIGSFNRVQRLVLMKILRDLNVTDPVEFLSSRRGQSIMGLYRRIVGTEFGVESPDMPNTDDPRFQNDPQGLANDIASKIISVLNGVK